MKYSFTQKSLDEAPIRLCCMQRHWEAQCPDGKVMCCLCFERFDLDQLALDEDGSVTDICQACSDYEQAQLKKHKL